MVDAVEQRDGALLAELLVAHLAAARDRLAASGFGDASEETASPFDL